MSEPSDVVIEIPDAAVAWLVEHLKGRPILVENQWLFHSVTGILEQGGVRVSSANRVNFAGSVRIEGGLRSGQGFALRGDIDATLQVQIDRHGVRLTVESLQFNRARASSPAVLFVARLLVRVVRLTRLRVLKSYPLMAPLRELFADQETGQVIVRHLVPVGAARMGSGDEACNVAIPEGLVLRFDLERPVTALVTISPVANIRRLLRG